MLAKLIGETSDEAHSKQHVGDEKRMSTMGCLLDAAEMCTMLG
jgi:hypothetical protein